MVNWTELKDRKYTKEEMKIIKARVSNYNKFKNSTYKKGCNGTLQQDIKKSQLLGGF